MLFLRYHQTVMTHKRRQCIVHEAKNASLFLDETVQRSANGTFKQNATDSKHILKQQQHKCLFVDKLDLNMHCTRK